MSPSQPSGKDEPARLLTIQDLVCLPTPPPDHSFSYGPDPNQFGELRLPKTPGPHPVGIVLHGGCWLAEYNLNHISGFAAALAQNGIAAWTFNYRKVGHPGGGWPGTFEDIAQGAASLRARARRYDLNLSKAVVIGHSAGGQLALWLASHARKARQSTLSTRKPIPLLGVFVLSGITDLRRAFEAGICGAALENLLGGSPRAFPDRYRAASPAELLPLGVDQHLMHGSKDSFVPVSMSEDYVKTARSRGDNASLTVIPDAGHFELIAPDSVASRHVIASIKILLVR
jgi:acetyl esterase/lipase